MLVNNPAVPIACWLPAGGWNLAQREQNEVKGTVIALCGAKRLLCPALGVWFPSPK